MLQATKTSKANWIGDILCSSCLLRYVTAGKTEGRIEVTGSRRRRRKQLMYDPKENRRYWILKAEALDRTVGRTRSERDYGPAVRRSTE
jgi:hypothetical protein